MTRVAYKSMIDIYRFNLERVSDELRNVTAAVASGKRINSSKDDPVGLSQVLNFRSNIADLEQVKRNIVTGRRWLTSGEAALTEVQGIISNCRELCVQYGSANVNPADRATAAGIALGYIKEIEAVSNTAVNDQYIFSGTKTDTPAYTLDDDDNPTVATYGGNSVPFKIKTGRDMTVDVGHDGETVFRDIFATLIDLKDSLEANDVDGINTVLGELNTEFDAVGSKISRNGVKTVRMDTRENIITELNFRYKENQSEIEDVDLAEAIMNLEATQLAYQAALTSASKVMQMSLADFM